jgi:hypothetical protein
MLDLAVAAALAEHQSRGARRPPAATETVAGSEWARQARAEGLR